MPDQDMKTEDKNVYDALPRHNSEATMTAEALAEAHLLHHDPLHVRKEEDLSPEERELAKRDKEARIAAAKSSKDSSASFDPLASHAPVHLSGRADPQFKFAIGDVLYHKKKKTEVKVKDMRVSDGAVRVELLDKKGRGTHEFLWANPDNLVKL